MTLINFSFKAPKTKALKKDAKPKERKTKTKRVKKFDIIERDVENVVIVLLMTFMAVM